MTPDDLTRTFRAKVSICDCGCWLFSSTDRYGYGQYKHNGRNHVAHRWLYTHYIGDLPDDMDIDHLCDRHRNCVNPEHFEVVDKATNSRRANARRKSQGGYRRTSETVPLEQKHPNPTSKGEHP